MLLDSNTKKIVVTLNGAVTTSPLQIVTSSEDTLKGMIGPLAQGVEKDATINSASEVDIVDAPEINTSRRVKYVSIHNTDSAPALVTIKLKYSSTYRTLAAITLPTGYALYYEDGRGYYVLDQNGSEVFTELSIAAIAIGDSVVGAVINEILYVDASGLLQQLHVATYPSLTELSYVKGLTSALQTQLNARELLTNKATDFSVINNTLYPTVQAVNNAITTAVVGLLDYRGGYDASSNLFPATGGSGLLGVILSGDIWICTVAGTLGGVSVVAGDLIIAKVDTPGQTAGNWDLVQVAGAYIPTSYLDTDGTLAANSDLKIATQKAVKTYVDAQTTVAASVAEMNAGTSNTKMATPSNLQNSTYGAAKNVFLSNNFI